MTYQVPLYITGHNFGLGTHLLDFILAKDTYTLVIGLHYDICRVGFGDSYQSYTL